MRYKVLSKAGIEVARERLASQKKVPDLRAHDVTVGAGELFDDGILKMLGHKLRKLQAEVAKGKHPVEELDRRAFALIHESIPRNDELMLADMDFWARFAICELSDVIVVRFPGRKGSVNLDNFGLGKRRECWPYKLWVRGEISHAEIEGDRYALGRLGGVDTWTSHVHRQNFMSVRQIFKSVFGVQYPKKLKGKPFLFEGEEDPGKGGVPGLRTLVKRLKENWASVEYAFLTQGEADELVRSHLTGLHRADGKSPVT